MYCSNCGKEVDEKADFCVNCGISLHKKNNHKGLIALIIVLIVIFVVLPFIFMLFLLTMPAIMKNTENQNYLAGAKKAENTFTEAILMNEAIEGKGVEGVGQNQITNLFEQRLNCTKTSSNSLLLADGMTVEFITNGKCSQGGCKAIVDINGHRPPNKKWSEYSTGDIVELTLTDRGAILPSYILERLK